MDASDCERLVKSVVSRHRFSEEICSGDDYNTLFYVLRLHPRLVEKTRGLNIKCFVIEPNPLGKGYTIYAILADGSKVDWSYRKACASINKSKSDIKKLDVYMAFRFAVSEQIEEFIRSRMICGKVLADDGKPCDRGEVDVHHKENTFRELVDEFLKLKGLRLERVEVADIGIGKDLADETLKKGWLEYHKKYAKLAILPRETHRQIHRG